jgi:hypothetical protein
MPELAPSGSPLFSTIVVLPPQASGIGGQEVVKDATAPADITLHNVTFSLPLLGFWENYKLTSVSEIGQI